jgi:hypothetical protein
MRISAVVFYQRLDNSAMRYRRILAIIEGVTMSLKLYLGVGLNQKSITHVEKIISDSHLTI